MDLRNWTIHPDCVHRGDRRCGGRALAGAFTAQADYGSGSREPVRRAVGATLRRAWSGAPSAIVSTIQATAAHRTVPWLIRWSQRPARRAEFVDGWTEPLYKAGCNLACTHSRSDGGIDIATICPEGNLQSGGSATALRKRASLS